MEVRLRTIPTHYSCELFSANFQVDVGSGVVSAARQVLHDAKCAVAVFEDDPELVRTRVVAPF